MSDMVTVMDAGEFDMDDTTSMVLETIILVCVNNDNKTLQPQQVKRSLDSSGRESTTLPFRKGYNLEQARSKLYRASTVAEADVISRRTADTPLQLAGLLVRSQKKSPRTTMKLAPPALVYICARHLQAVQTQKLIN